jgi:beta-lactamase class A
MPNKAESGKENIMVKENGVFPRTKILFPPTAILLIMLASGNCARPQFSETEGRTETLAVRLEAVQNIEAIEAIERQTPGTIGVYIRSLRDDQTLARNADLLWYLSSTIKVQVAVALLMMVEEGVHSLSDRLTLKETDFVDGAGGLHWSEPGGEYTLETLLRMSLEQSDSTATDMLIRLIGEDELNRRIRDDMVADGFTPFTTILQVRYDAYSEIHPDAGRLSNMDFIRIHSTRSRTERYNRFIEKLQVDPRETGAKSIEEAFEKYYSRELNSGTLEAFGRLLERLNGKELLSEKHTELIIGMMKNIVTGDRRIKAGLPDGTSFAQKTGTQIERACTMGIVNPLTDDAVIVAACVKNYGDISNAEKFFQNIGAALSTAE